MQAVARVISPSPRRNRRLSVMVIAMLAAAVVYSALLIAHARTRKPWNDEAMAAGAGLTLATTGRPGLPVFDESDPAFTRIHQHMYFIFPAQMVVLAAWYKVVGFGLFTTRALSMLWALALLCLLYRLLTALGASKTVAALTVILTAFDYQMMSAASFGRYDTMVAALGLAGYVSYLALRRRNFSAALLSGNACIAAAGMTHPNGLVYFIGLWFLILYHDRSKLRVRHAALAAVPYAIGGAVWAWYILQDLPAFRAQLAANASGNRVLLLHPWWALKSEIVNRYLTSYGLGGHSPGHAGNFIALKALAIPAYMAGIIGYFALREVREFRGYRVLASLALIHFCFLTFYEGMKFNYYLVHMIPFYMALLAASAHALWARSPRPRWLIVGSLAGVAALGPGGIAAKVRLDDFHNSYAPAVAFLQRHASPQDLIFAACSLGFGYGFKPTLVDDETFGYYSMRQPRFIVMEEIYDDATNLNRQRHPAIYAHEMALFSLYRLIYSRANYRVYVKEPQEVDASRLTPRSPR